jgi:hypothetical protein
MRRLSLMLFVVVAVAVFGWFQFQPTVHAQDNLTPGMLFGPLSVGFGEHVKVCFSNLSEGDITADIHFRNITTGEVTAKQTLTVTTGGGACATYYGRGLVVGMARGDGRASDWVSPSNALISTMSVVSKGGRAGATVLGVAKIWLKGL